MTEHQKIKWVYQKKHSWRRIFKPQKPISKWLIVFYFSTALMLSFYIFVWYKDLESRSKANLSTIWIENQNPVFVGTYEYGGGGKSTSQIGMKLVGKKGWHVHVMAGDLPFDFPNKMQYRYDAALQKKLPDNFQELQNAPIKIVYMRSLVWGKIKQQDGLETLYTRLLRRNKKLFSHASEPVYVLSTDIQYWRNGTLYHYQRPEKEYRHLINADCSDCVRDFKSLSDVEN